MSIRTLHFSCNVRPVRLAFLVDKPDPTILEEVFRQNTLLWGGCLNPVVILNGSTRKVVGRHYQFHDTPYEEEAFLTLKEFDPDVLINFNNATLPAFLDVFRRRIFSRDALRWNPWGRQEVPFFLQVFPFLRQYWREEVRPTNAPPHKFCYLDLDSGNPLTPFLVARFGAYPSEAQGIELLADRFSGMGIKYDESFRKTPDLSQWIFPTRITLFGLNVPSPKPYHSRIFFLLDPADMFDVADYWNLRAAGFLVFPLPINDYPDSADRARAFAEESAYAINTSVMAGPTIVKSRSLQDDQLDEAGKWLIGLRLKNSIPSLMGWVPRYGMRHERAEPDVHVRPASAKEASEIVISNEGLGTFQGAAPDCALLDNEDSQHWALDLRVYGGGDDSTFRFPWLHPSCDEVASYRFGHEHGPAASRVSKQGIVVMPNGGGQSALVHEPKVVEVFRAYLKDARLTYLKTSSAGLALDRIIEQMGDLYRCQLFQNSGVRALVAALADGSPRAGQLIRQTIYSAIPSDRGDRQKQGHDILDNLLSHQLLRQGFELQCDKCQRCDWYHLGELAEQFKCKKCFHVQLVPLLDRKSWSYVSNGILRLEGKMAGCMTTILALIFLQFFSDLGMKIVSSFDYTDDTNSAERDFAVLSAGSFDEDVDVIIGECKTSYDLKEKEKQDIRRLGQHTKAYVAFATDSDQFSEDDKLFFTELVELGLKPILLTRRHLEMSHLNVGEYRHQGTGLGRSA